MRRDIIIIIDLDSRSSKTIAGKAFKHLFWIAVDCRDHQI